MCFGAGWPKLCTSCEVHVVRRLGGCWIQGGCWVSGRDRWPFVCVYDSRTSFRRLHSPFQILISWGGAMKEHIAGWSMVTPYRQLSHESVERSHLIVYRICPHPLALHLRCKCGNVLCHCLHIKADLWADRLWRCISTGPWRTTLAASSDRNCP